MQLVGAIHPGRLFDFQGHSLEKAHQQPYGVGHRERQIHNDEARAVVHHPRLAHDDGIGHRQQDGWEHIGGDKHPGQNLAKLGKETDHAVSPQSGNGNSDQRRTTGHDDAVDDIDVKMELSQHGLEKIKGDFLRQDGGRVACELTLALDGGEENPQQWKRGNDGQDGQISITDDIT